jgi:hypothetical protein
MKKDYKVEMKPTYWEVILSIGEYSDYTEKHLFFSGNDELEVWNFLKRYMLDNAQKEKRFGEMVIYKDDRFIFSQGNDAYNNYYDRYDVEIKRLNVIYFNK